MNQLLRQLGLQSYYDGVNNEVHSHGPELKKLHHLIQTEFQGPDCYWKPKAPPYPVGVTSFFGRLSVLPFPFVAVIKYDQGGAEHWLTTYEELKEFVKQNQSKDIKSKKKLREALRALDGQKIFHPYMDVQQVGKKNEGLRLPFRKQPSSYSMTVQTTFRIGTLRIKRNSDLCWRG